MRRGPASSLFSEALLRRIWQRQSFSSSGLKTSDGRSITILSPGTPNLDGGPDFRDAAMRIGRVTYRGDIELHINARSWEAHRHQNDPHYNSVILHVVLTAEDPNPESHTVSQRLLPLLILHPYLDPCLEKEVSHTLLDDGNPATFALPCAGKSDTIPLELIKAWVIELSRQRLELRIQRLEERLKQLAGETRGTVREPYPRFYGNPGEIPSPSHVFTARDFSARGLWEQLLYEGLMEGLGYSKNRVPFLALARSLRIDFLREQGIQNTRMMMALLLGAAGLLPSTRTIREKESRDYLRPLRKIWRDCRPRVRKPLLHEGDWLFFRLRPVNFPTARLACLAYLLPRLFRQDALREIIGLFREPAGHRQVLAALQSMFAFEPDSYWRHHCHFRGSSSRKGIALGRDRIDELILNTVLPLVLLYARVFRLPDMRDRALRLLQHIPPSPGNSITRVVERQLLHDRLDFRTGVFQQGMIQLFRAYCLPRRCDECTVGRQPSPDQHV